MNNTLAYILDFLARFPVSQTGIVHYGRPEDASDTAKIIIVPAFPGFDITSLPVLPFIKIDDTPVFFGDSRIERQNGTIIVYADIIASSFFLLSRYEETLKPECRDCHGRFCAKDSVVFQQGYGSRPLVDEYGVLLRKWLRETGVIIPDEKTGLSKVYLTHDIDEPFRFYHPGSVCKQYAKNMFRYNYTDHPLKKYLDERYDDYNTFSKIIDYDNNLRETSSEIPVEIIYFIIVAGSFFNRKYYNFHSKKSNF